MTTIDPATIVLALSLGAAACHQDHCPPTVQDAYCDLKTAFQAAYPAVHIALLEEDPKRQMYRALLAEDLTQTGAHHDHTIRTQAAALLFAVHHHAPKLPPTVGVHIENAVAAGSILVQDITSSADGVVIQAAQAGHNIQVSNVQAGLTGAATTTTAPTTTVSVHGSSAGEAINIHTAPEIHYHFPDQEPARRWPELEANDAANRRKTGLARVELKLERPFETFTSDEQSRFLLALQHILGLGDEVHIVNVRSGSTLVTLELPDSAVNTLAELIHTDQLAEFGFTAIRRIYNLSGADLAGADLSGADLSGAYLVRDILSGSDLTSTDLHPTPSTLIARFFHSFIARFFHGSEYPAAMAIGPSAVFAGADLSGANLPGADLTKANFTGADLTKANLTGANLTGANLTGANFTGADLTKANLTGANLSEIILRFARRDWGTRWPKGFDYQHSGAIGPSTDFTGADLTGADLTGANLGHANLTGADLTGFNLTEVDLAMADLIGANLSGANLTRAHLLGSRLIGANLTGADLTLADLFGASLSGADLSGADLSGANLSRANLSGANLSGANLSGANLRGTNLTAIIYDEHTIWPDDLERIRIYEPVGIH